MVTLQQVRGQDRAVAHLEQAIDGDRVAHAYLFVGPAGAGKYTVGLALAAALNCEVKPGRGCGECTACHKIATDAHPDVVTLKREGAARIVPIDAIRKQVIPRLASPPHEGRARVFLVEEANALAGPSANALLKTLEEPPPRTHFVLATTAADKVLPTIRSRCQRISFASRSADDRATDDGAEARAAQVEALSVAADPASPLEAAYAAASDIAGDRAHLTTVLEMLAERFHRRAIDAARAGQLGAAARMSRRAGEVLETQVAVSLHNAHGQLAVERLFFSLRQPT